MERKRGLNHWRVSTRTGLKQTKILKVLTPRGVLISDRYLHDEINSFVASSLLDILDRLMKNIGIDIDIGVCIGIGTGDASPNIYVV